MADRNGGLTIRAAVLADTCERTLVAAARAQRIGTRRGVGGRLRYFENTGTAIAAAFVRLTGAANPLTGEDVGSNSAPAAADLNGDGTPDLVTGALAGTFAVHYFPEPSRGLWLGAGIALMKLLERARRRRAR